MPLATQRRPLVVGLGEALFDCFGDRAVLGGAPLNVVVHAKRLLERHGGTALPVTRVGVDALGARLRDELAGRGIDQQYVQRDPVRPTGRVDVTRDAAGDANYVFLADCAWDAIEHDAPLELLAGLCDAVVYGTLAQRCEHSRRTVRRFLAAAEGAQRVFDVNLRQDFYSAEVIESSFRLATAAKLNLEELQHVGGLLGIDNWDRLVDEERAAAIANAYGLDWVATTAGSDGTTLFIAGDRHTAPVPYFPIDTQADSVGAGDACCAALVVGDLLGWPPAERVGLANRLGAYVASKQGATPDLPDEAID